MILNNLETLMFKHSYIAGIFAAFLAVPATLLAASLLAEGLMQSTDTRNGSSVSGVFFSMSRLRASYS